MSTERLAHGELLAATVAAGGPVLTDGGIETRIMFETDLVMDPHVQVAALVRDPAGRAALRAIHTGYLDAAAEHGLPLVLGTPTFRASAAPAARAGLDADALAALNVDAARLLLDLRAEHGHAPVWIAGVVGPAGDAYLPEEALDEDAAHRYHRAQCEALAGAGVDLLFAATFPAVPEACGVARAMAETGLPYVVSFVLDAGGRVLDGTPLAAAVRRVEAIAAPVWVSISCVHPTVAARALDAAGELATRVREVKANASALTPAELVALDHPETDPPGVWAEAAMALREAYGLPVLGGCCGTDDRHIRQLAARLSHPPTG